MFSLPLFLHSSLSSLSLSLSQSLSLSLPFFLTLYPYFSPSLVFTTSFHSTTHKIPYKFISSLSLAHTQKHKHSVCVSFSFMCTYINFRARLFVFVIRNSMLTLTATSKLHAFHKQVNKGATR